MTTLHSCKVMADVYDCACDIDNMSMIVPVIQTIQKQMTTLHSCKMMADVYDCACDTDNGAQNLPLMCELDVVLAHSGENGLRHAAVEDGRRVAGHQQLVHPSHQTGTAGGGGVGGSRPTAWPLSPGMPLLLLLLIFLVFLRNSGKHPIAGIATAGSRYRGSRPFRDRAGLNEGGGTTACGQCLCDVPALVEDEVGVPMALPLAGLPAGGEGSTATEVREPWPKPNEYVSGGGREEDGRATGLARSIKEGRNSRAHPKEKEVIVAKLR